MNITYYQNQVNRLEGEIATIYKKIAEESKKENDKSKQIDSVLRSITKTTSISTYQSKQRQIQGYQNDISNIKKKIAEYQKNLATKSVELGKKKQEVRKAEEIENKKQQKEQLDFQRKLQDDMVKHKSLMNNLFTMQHIPQENSILTTTPEKEFDFFISHASEDKDDFVRSLADKLKAEKYEVWYDEFELKVGDSLRKKIDYGLSKSKYGIVVISPDFIRKNWTEYEFNGMIAREMNGQKVILPIWHKVTKDEVLKYSPTLADKMALNTAIHSIDEIVKSLQEVYF